MKKFFCDSACFLLALTLLMVWGAVIEGSFAFLPALGISLVLGFGIRVLYLIGWGDPIFPQLRKPKQALQVTSSSHHRLGAA